MTTRTVKPPLSRAEGEALRQDYLAGMTVHQICVKYACGQYAVYHWLKGGPKVNGVRLLPPVEQRVALRRRKPAREQLVARLWRAARTQVKSLEGRLKDASEPDESNARTMAVLVRTLRDLHDLEDGKVKRRRDARMAVDSNSDESGRDERAKNNPDRDDPREIDEFRRELARRIAALDAAATGETAGGT